MEYCIGHIIYGQCGFADDIQMVIYSIIGLLELFDVSDEFGR